MTRSKETRAKWLASVKSKGLCPRCGTGEPRRGFKSCQRCADTYKLWAIRLNRKNLCITCKADVASSGRGLRCVACKKKARELREQLVENGKCYRCGDNPICSTSRSWCRSCLDSENKKSKDRQNARSAKGNCIACGIREAWAGERCLRCWFMRLAAEHKAIKEDLYELLIEQDFKCALTGEDLLPGVSASLDHVVPVSRGGTSSRSNLRFTTIRSNWIKDDMTTFEFVALCQKVVDYAKSRPYK
jgi:hypothetical protein